MKSLKEFSKNLKTAPSDCTGIDVGSTVIKVVRLKATGSEITVIGAALVKPETNGSITIPLNLRARYASIATSCRGAIVKLLKFPGAIESSFESSLPQKIGINSDQNYRISYTALVEGNSRSDSSVLIGALPEEDAKSVMHNFSSGIPAPYSLELSTLAVLTAFEHGPVANNSGDTTGLIDFGTTETFLSIFHNKKLVLLRKFDFGTNIVMERLKSTLHVTTEVAHGMIDDSSFDLSDMLAEHMSSVAGDLILSRDFIERQDNCKINMLYAIGGVALSTSAMQSLEKFMNIDITPWNPFDGLKVAPHIFENEMKGQRWRFAGALGAALATLEKK